MTRIEIPIRVRFERIQTKWEIRTVEGNSRHKAALYAFPTISADYTIKELDPWKCRDAFFAIPEGDSLKLRKFLDKVGVWLREETGNLRHWSEGVTRHCAEGNPTPISVEGLWKFRDSLKTAMVDEKARKELASGSDLEFPFTLEVTDVASGALAISDVYHMLIATAIFDAARGIRFGICALEECKRPFPFKTRPEKKFCQWKCAHVATERRNRPLRAAKKEASLAPPKGRGR